MTIVLSAAASASDFSCIDAAAFEAIPPPDTNPVPPVWYENPMTGDPGLAGLAYIGTLAGKAYDANHDPITYTRDPGGPSWLAVAPDGSLSGTPTNGGVGTNSFTVVASDAVSSTAATLHIIVNEPPPAEGPLTLWYSTPATDWQSQALPIGNGRLGGMLYGGVTQERLQFNEDSLWTGDEHPSGVWDDAGNNGTGAYQNFGDVR